MAGWRNWFVGALIAAALVGAVLHLGELRNFAELLRKAQPLWLLIALLLQASTYLSLALGWRTVLRKAERRRYGMAPLVRIALSKLFADQALPTAGMSGNVVLVDQLVRIGASRGTAVATLLLSMLGFYTAYLVFALAALFLLWMHGHAGPMLVGLVTTFVLVAIAIPALALWLRQRGSRPLPPAVERIRPIRQLLATIGEAPAELVKDRRLLLELTLCNGLIFAADVLTLAACLQALGTAPALSTAFIGFILASIVVTLGPIPFGLGSFEAVCTSALHMLGVPLEAAFAGTVLLRVLILWLPLAPGLLLSRRMLAKRRKRRKQPG